MRWEWVALLAVLCAGAWRDTTLLTQPPVAVGVDGYYYVLQADSLRERNGPYFPTSYPLILYALAGVSHVIGDTVIAIKICSIALHVLLCAGVFALVSTATRSPWLGVLGSALTAASSLHLYMVAEFINNLGAVTLLTWGAWMLIRWAHTCRRIYVCGAVACLIAASLSHRSAILILFAVAGAALLLRVLSNRRRAARFLSLVMLLTIASWLIPAAFDTLPSAGLPAWLRDEVSLVPSWPWRRPALAEGIALLIISPAILFLSSKPLRGPQGRPEIYLFGSIALLTLLFTLNPFIKSAQGWGGAAERLRGLAYIQVAILLPGAIRMSARMDVKTTPYLLAMVAPLILLGYTAPPPPGVEADYVMRRAEMVKGLRGHALLMGKDSVVIAPHGDQFVVTYATGLPSEQRLLGSTDGRTVYWLLRRMRCSGPFDSMMVLASDGGHLCTVIVRDHELRQNSTALGDLDRQRLLAANPHVRDIPDLIN